MRFRETLVLDAGTIITEWPALTAAGEGLSIQLPRPFVVPLTTTYAIETDTAAGTVTIQRASASPTPVPEIQRQMDLERRARQGR